MYDELIGKTLNGSYRINEVIADGGMSRVYLAEQISLSRKVALKVLAPGFEDQDFIELFLREARINSHLNHSNIVKVLDFGITEDNIVFLAMEYLDGGTLDLAVDKTQGLMLSQIVWLFEQLCQAVNAAHKLNVVHRDLKPGNIMLASMSGSDVVAKIVDFGISKPLAESDLKHTQLGMIIGTPGFLAPEQIRGVSDLDARADIYALGAILYYCASGKKPYACSIRDVIMQKQLTELPANLVSDSLADPDCEILQSVINKAMAINRDKRYQTVAEFWQALLSCVEETKVNQAVKQVIEVTTSSDDEQHNYQLVFLGDIDEQLDIEHVKVKLKRLFKLSDKHLDAFLSGKRVVIRKNLTLSEVEKLAEAISRIGLETSIEEMSDMTRLMNRETDPLPEAKLGQPISIAQLRKIHTQPTPAMVAAQDRQLAFSSEREVTANSATDASAKMSTSKWLILVLSMVLLASAVLIVSVNSVRYRLLDQIQGIEPQRGVTTDLLRIGLSAPFSGGARELGRAMKLGIEVHFNEVNKTGGIHGRQLQLLALDDGYEPKKVIENRHQFFDFQSGVFAFLGNVGTPTNKAFLPYLYEEKTVLLGPLTGANVFRKTPPDRYLFNYRASYKEELSALLKYFIEEKGASINNIGVLYQDDSFGRDGLARLEKILHHQYQIKDKNRLRISASYQRNTAQIAQAVDLFQPFLNQLDVILIVGTYSTSAEFTKLIKQQGYKGHIGNLSFVGTDALVEAFREMGHSYGEGVVISQVVPMYFGHSNSAQHFAKALAEYGQADQGDQGDFVAFEGYIAARLLTHALEKAGRDITTQGLITTLETMAPLDLGTGLAIGFKPSDHQASHLVWGSIINAEGNIEALYFND